MPVGGVNPGFMSSFGSSYGGGYGGGGGFGSLSDFAAGGGFGLNLANIFGQFRNQMGAGKRAVHDTAEAFETSSAVLRDLLGIATGNVLTHPGNEFVGGMEDPRSRYLPTGTLMSGPAGGINPLVVKARENIYNLIQSQAVQPKDLEMLQMLGSRGLGANLEASARAPARNPRELLANLMNFGGAGQTRANIGLQAAIANRDFARQVAGQGTNFLNQLFAIAGGAV